MWISVEDALPLLQKKVYVRGTYISDDYEYPVAWLRWFRPYAVPQWDGLQWRATVGITHWWLE